MIQEKEGFRLKRGKSIVLTGLLLVVFFTCSACGTQENRTEQNDNNEQDTQIQAVEAQFRGILQSVDPGLEQITFYNLNFDNEVTLTNAMGTSIYNASGSLTTIASLEYGAIVQVSYNRSTMEATTIKVDEEAWCYNDITNWSVNRKENILNIAGIKYQYNSGTLILSDQIPQDIMSLNPVDKLRVYGIGKRIYSIIVAEGHGYIRPQEYQDFVGGTVSVGYIMNQPIDEDMLLIVREGIYEVSMKNGNLSGTRTIEVKRDEESLLDMSMFRQNPENVGQVNFAIAPRGADLYINGKYTEYGDFVPLNYGEHKIVVSLLGYATYSGILNISSPNPTVKISLSDELAEVEEEDDNTEGETTATQSNSTSESTRDEAKIQYDKEHVISISTPEGAEVYMNGSYRGIAPCNFPKEIGTQTITLSKEGFITKSYTVVIPDDSEDIAWSFVALEKK